MKASSLFKEDPNVGIPLVAAEDADTIINTDGGAGIMDDEGDDSDEEELDEFDAMLGDMFPDGEPK